ncbi:branched-chain amino acid ABC transporter permease [Verminephrobacter eiseniae]|uniref:branched-chain amino acid ABC transporter permease n=1 Tax=Verminephrobacter eiseniae TaxID=364317 RepID=UPI002238FB43|nr:branched-chain amino acid ABC transporter permease [Verminephrobacter eiseniae]
MTPDPSHKPASSTLQRNMVIAAAALVIAVPLLDPGQYLVHLLIMCLMWSYIYTSWSIMGRLGLVSFGHGAFLGVGAYTGVLLWNYLGVSPWLGALCAVAATALLAVVVGYPCFRLKIVGHYFALVTLALSEVVRLVIVGLREITGGSLGMTPHTALMEGQQISLMAMQFSNKHIWLCLMLACWLIGLYVWHRVDRSMARLALQAISEQEEAAASIGINVRGVKLALMVLSAAMTCLGGVLYAQYQLYVNPENLSGIGVSLQMVFGVVTGGMFVLLGPTVGAVFLLLLSEGLRLVIGNDLHGVDLMVYGALLVIFIIFMPKGILGTLLQRLDERAARPRPDAMPPMPQPPIAATPETR